MASNNTAQYPTMREALEQVAALLQDWPTMRALSATGAQIATERKAKAQEIIAAALGASAGQDAAPVADINKIELSVHEESHGWGHGVLFGADMGRGWTLECDMESGNLLAAFTPAGVDPLFLLNAKPVPRADGEARWPHTEAVITVEGGVGEWNAEARTLTIRNY